jgi:hypothetical protein
VPGVAVVVGQLAVGERGGNGQRQIRLAHAGLAAQRGDGPGGQVARPYPFHRRRLDLGQRLHVGAKHMPSGFVVPSQGTHNSLSNYKLQISKLLLLRISLYC